jgi:phage shock protein PspC (stress-responsive transcriptional regulator)
MDKTININLGGVLFQIDEEAFGILRDYLQAINYRFGNVTGGHETIEDIESRIAEIFQSQRGTAGVITTDNVKKMIDIIGKPEDFDQVGSETEAPVYSYRKKRMYRNPDDTIIGGVCSGIATYIDSDPVIFRVLFVVFAAFFGVGFFIYLGLWIALPSARTETQKRELHGSNYYDTQKHVYKSSTLGNAFNEIFKAMGRVIYIIFRVFMIMIGVFLVLTGFLFILSFVVLFIFKYPGIFSIDSSGVNFINLSAFLDFMVNPATVPWIWILTSIVVLLPMLAFIYWGVKMIFWFNARDGVVSLIALVVWVMSVAALSIIGFNEGISFAKRASLSAEIMIPQAPDTLFINSGSRISDLIYEKEFSLPHDEYSVFINDDRDELYIRPVLDIEISDDKSVSLEVTKSSAGKTETEASTKTAGLNYNYKLKNDSLNIDEYFTIPSGRKWAADHIEINLKIPSGTIVKFEGASGLRVHGFRVHGVIHNENGETYYTRWESQSGIGYWIMTDDGLKKFEKHSSSSK